MGIIDKVIEVVCKEYNISKEDLLSDKKHRIYADARAFIVYILLNEGINYIEATRAINRTRIAAYSYNKKINDLIMTSKREKYLYDDICKQLFNNLKK